MNLVFNRIIKKGTSLIIFSNGRNFSSHPSKVLKGIVSPPRTVPRHIEHPSYALTGEVPACPKDVYGFSDEEILRMRESAFLARRMLDFACSKVEVGITTDDIDALTHDEIVRNGAYPSPLNYAGFPKSICTSVNEVVCHGIPDNRELEKGDIVSIDISLYYNGFHGDNCATVIADDSSNFDSTSTTEIRPTIKLIEGTKNALYESIAGIGPGICISQIGNIIENHAVSQGLDVVSEFCGHGVGKLLHMQPLIRHFKNNYKFLLRPNMVITIEPILTAGDPGLQMWDDGWTAVTADGSWAAQFEHEVLITNHGAEIITVTA